MPRQASKEWALEYTEKLEAGGRFKLQIWPYHCIIGTPGHSVYAPLQVALDDWAIRRAKCIQYLCKGMNNFTEMYSAFKAEVEIPADPATSLNQSYIQDLTNCSKIICC